MRSDHPIDALSAREIEVLEMAAQGLTNTRIAADLGVTIHAVKFHLASIYRKLHVGNRTEAAAVLFRVKSADAQTEVAS
ncbi:MAG TPA: helix-turn-helix transcriptional regulator [Gaiellaceae bacterium]|nr:helix-turn-helix transcriptional regulator [Gaiellaceae bacterium]